MASFGSTAVLAEDPACVVDGQPVSQQQYDADHSLCPEGPNGLAQSAPAPAPEPEPAPPAEPAPTDPAPTEPAPTEPAPTEPAPTDPAPTEPAPADPAPTDPAPTEPAPADPAPTDPAPVDPGPTTPTPPAPTSEDPGDTTPTGTDPATDTTGTTTPAPPTPATPVRDETPPAPAKPDVRTEDGRTEAMLEAKQFQAAPFRDARLFREQFTPTGRIPSQPQLSQEDAQLLFDAAEGTGTSWSLLASVAWLESRWGDPSAGGLVGRRLLDVAWETHGTDGDGDGVVDRASAADQAKTVAVFLAEARDSKQAALEAYFSGTRREVMAERAIFLADYFDALGKQALVDGLDDPEARKALEERVLANEDISLYDGGRSDIADGLVDPRVLVTLEFLANRFDSITVSSLISGHGVYTAGGNVSLHSYGQAVDIAALDDESILGNQQKGSNTYRAVQEVLLLPASMQPAELISLWDMGGASFAMSDHHDHIHIGWKTEPGPSFGEDSHGH